jgi:hypothetical protein
VYCSYMGTCSADGMSCCCSDLNRWGIERCAIYHNSPP